MIFEIGKCYQHSSGHKLRIIGRLNTYFWGDSVLIAETDEAKLIAVGETEDHSVNYIECSDFALDKESNNET